MMIKKMRGKFVLTVLFSLFVICLCGSMITVGAANLADQCTDDLQKVTECLNYATGKATTPTKDCCTSVSDTRKSDPVCLCYIIQQVHNGTQTIKRLGLQEAKLLQLPSACKLANASISDCPKLLNIPSTSPDYAIFTNASLANASTTPPAASTTATNNDSSNGFKHGHSLAAPVAIAMAIFFYAFPSGSASTFNT